MIEMNIVDVITMPNMGRYRNNTSRERKLKQHRYITGNIITGPHQRLSMRKGDLICTVSGSLIVASTITSAP